jgi:TonB family protein
MFGRLSSYSLIVLAWGLSIPRPALPQEKTPSDFTQPPLPSASNTTEGLKELLQDVRAAAKSGDMGKVASFLKSMEIPNCDTWLHQMYESDSADSWMSLCDPKTLRSQEEFMQKHFAILAQQEGEIVTRKVNDDPEPGRGMEWGWLQAIRQPLDIYFAAWKTAAGSKPQAIGYFMYVDGGFRWESDLNMGAPKIGSLKLAVPKLIDRVPPECPSDALARHITGTVRVRFIIGTDGAVRDAHAVPGEGLSDEPSLRRAAENAVLQWRYEPATLDGKPIEMNDWTADFTFSPRN